MKKSKYSNSQIMATFKQTEAGTPVLEDENRRLKKTYVEERLKVRIII